MLQFGPNIWYYNKSIKNMLIGFLNLFPEFRIKRFNSFTNKEESDNRVHILFGPIERSSYINSKGETVKRLVELPLLHFELNSLEIDKNRVFPLKTQYYVDFNENETIINLKPYPYIFNINLTIFAKYQEDLMQLLEQIVPLFNYHRVFYTTHPIFLNITLTHWVMITSYPNFSLNHEYSAEERRGILSTTISFQIESWLVREAYKDYNLIKEIILNYHDYINQTGLYSKINLIADPTIRELIYIADKNDNSIKIGDIISTTKHNAIIVDIDNNYCEYNYDLSLDEKYNNWKENEKYIMKKIIIKFNTETENFFINEEIKNNNNKIFGIVVKSEPYQVFKQKNFKGYSGYSGYLETKYDY